MGKMTGMLLMGVPLGAAGGPLPFSDDFERADGDLSNGWEYSDSAWVISGGKAVATLPYSENKLQNGDFETGNPPTAWTPGTGATLGQVEDTRPGGAGTYALEITASQPADVSQVSGNAINEIVLAEAWGEVVSGTTIALALQRVWATSSATDWTLLIGSAYAHTTGARLYLLVNGTTGSSIVARFDDASARTCSFADAIAVRNTETPNTRVSFTVELESQLLRGLVLALDDRDNPQNYIFISFQGSALYIDKYVAGARTQLTPSYVLLPITTQSTIAAEYTPPILRVFANGGQIYQDIKINDPGIVANTLHGMLATHPDTPIMSASFVASSPAIALNGSYDAIFKVTTSAADLWSSAAEPNWLGRPVLLDDGSKWLSIYKQGNNHAPAAADVFHIRFSEDEGASWTAADTWTDGAPVTGFPLQKDNGISDAIIFKAPNGDLLVHGYAHTLVGTYQWRSTDGGETWTDEGLIDDGDVLMVGGQDYEIIGTDIYVTAFWISGGVTKPGFWKSSDNGTTWIELGHVDVDGTEAGIIHLGGTTLLMVIKDSAALVTYQSISNDLGVTWSAATAIADLGVVQRPRIKAYAGGYMMYGRAGAGSAAGKTVVLYSPNGTQWGRRFWPDPTAGGDTGYCDVLPRSDGKFYWQSYNGSTSSASVRHGVFEIGT